MNNLRISIAFLFSIFILSCEQKSADDILKEKIIGTWSASYPARHSNDISAYGEGTYYADGTFRGWNKISFPDGTIKEKFYSESWEIKDRKLILRPEKIHDSPEMNSVIVDYIESIDHQTMILINKKGEKLIRKKVASNN
ncbi:hypothetical protein [Kangiella koreensis]|uniref:Lipocalin-like domain-containing protein n=1 Tax=Kangiella koreensis (strain DSM 16069 / JCM 12317 / KCTC 12182 / SW-125) TaxID=523791 RepID=C7R7M6_KANKD|nr:hypothetical protein [Kangiella koreensis]ACV27559.1 hypothetical protein Kkor_2149 [Kangiella koreensis DSM 16069]